MGGYEPIFIFLLFTFYPINDGWKSASFKLYKVHAHYNELDAIYAFNFQPSQCLYYVIMRIIGAGVSLFKILLLINGC